MLHREEEAGLRNILFEHYTVFCVFFALFMLTWIGVGDVRTVSMAGLILCLAGVAQSSADVDLQILMPLGFYIILNMASSYAAHGNLTEGYGGIQLILPTMYLLTASMDAFEQRLLRRVCAAWAGLVAAAGVIAYVAGAVLWDKAGRLDGILGNPNAMGIFMVMGWFANQRVRLEQPSVDGKRAFGERLRIRLEPVLLMALALTMSMGSFVAMAAGILVLAASECRREKQKFLGYLLRILAKAVLGIGTGMLLYLGVVGTGVRWISIPLSLYALALIGCWEDLDCFLESHTRTTVCLAGAGVLVAAASVAARSGSVSTFAERLEMMRSGVSYLTANPFLGVGPFEWRLLDMQDGGAYFGTWHIHNLLLHAAVEFGWLAAAMLILLVFRFYRKKADAFAKAGFAAYCVHNLMDASFFYIGITAFALLMAGDPAQGGRRIGNTRLKALFILLAALHAIHLADMPAW